jgi:hypothetical protein
MWERHQLFFGLRLAGKKFHHSATRTKIELHFGGFFHEAAQNFEVFSNIQDQK